MKTSGFHGMRSFLARATVKSASAVFSAICFVIAAWHSLPDLSALLGRPLCLCVTVCSVPEWRGLVCQIWPKWVASYFSESSVSHFWCWKLQAGETEIVGDLNRMTIYLPYERFHLWRVNVCVCCTASEEGGTFSRIQSVTRPKRCAQFAFQMRREERERVPLGVMLYIRTCVVMCVRQGRCFVFSMLWCVWTV